MKEPLKSTLVEKAKSPLRFMRTGGTSSLKSARVPYPGMEQVVLMIKEMIKHYRGEEFVRQKALDITRNVKRNPTTGHPDLRNYDNIAEAVYNWIVKNIRYVRDQNGIERLQTPDATLQLGTGDCDDMVILAGSLLESIGVPTRIQIIGERRGKYSHIYLDYDSKGEWKSFDTTLALFPGFEFPTDLVKAKKTYPIERPSARLTFPSRLRAEASRAGGESFFTH